MPDSQDRSARHISGNEAALETARDWPEHLERAWNRDLKIDLRIENVKGVCIVGMGGSAIGGAMVRAALGPVLKVPLELARGYGLPGWVDRDWLVVAVSYSGNTAETLAAFELAGKRGCGRLALTTGGRLAAEADSVGVPVVEIPTGFQPRAALPYLLVPLLRVLGGFCEPAPEWDTGRIYRGLKEREDLLAEAGRIAEVLEGRMAVVYAWERFEPVAYRWRTQMNENAKVLAFHHVLPEADHNDIVGWMGAPEGMAVVLLRTSLEPPEVAARFELTRKLAWEKGARVVEVTARGDSALAQILWLVQTGDVASVMLADRLGVEATPVKVIEALKRELATREA